MTVRAVEAAGVTALALVLTLILAGSVLREPSHRIFGSEIVGRHHDPFTAMEHFRRPLAMGVYLQPLTDIPGALLTRAIGPVPAYNWLVLLTFPLSAAAAYLLARHLALVPASAAVAAIVFAFSPFHLAHAAYHPHVAQTQWIPLYLLALWRCLDNPGPAAVGLLALSAATVTLSNFYGGLIAAVITPVAIAAYWWFRVRRQPGSIRRLVITAGSLAVIAAGGAAYAWRAAPAVVVQPDAFGFPRADLFLYSAKWWSYLVPPVEHPVLGALAGQVWSSAGVREGLLEQQVSLGWGIVALAIVAVIFWVIRGRKQPSVAAVPILAAVGIAALLCSLSPERAIGPVTFVRPSAALYAVLPMFRSYARFAVVVQLMAALLAAIGAERLWRTGRRPARALCLALLTLAAGEYAVWPPELSRDVLPTAAHRWAAEQPDGVRVLDCAPLTPESQSIQWLSGGRISLQHGSLDDCTEPNFADKLSAAGYTHLLVRRDSPALQWFSNPRAPSGFRALARFEQDEIFAVTAPSPTVYTRQMTSFHAREFDSDWTWRWMGAAASWTIVNRSSGPIAASLDIEMTAFNRHRSLDLLLDGVALQTLTISPRRGVNRIGPVRLTPGEHHLIFRSTAPPTTADELLRNGDQRALSFGFGAWHWVVEGARP